MSGATREVKIARISVVIIFLALIRCIAECFRLRYIADAPTGFDDLEVFLKGALAASVALLLMTILSFYSKSRLVILCSVLAIVVLVLIKQGQI